ncbi:Flagellar protein FlbB [Rhodovulum sp. P5]|uniref:MotE family protein n=1 Tax=Rhodovulum sp. P5 TaxID=1564506 RepID=UPI0009C36E2E|nr:hypothetical protein [Rhodovulum sp. P5]ARE40413.1 Flagellar protein FlbB [Rhodovulum sp. P5]
MSRPTKSKPKSKPKTASRAVLPVIAGLFLASGVVRLGGGTAQALTEELRHLDKGAQSHADATHGAGEAPCPPPPEIASVLEALQKREAELDRREAFLANRAATLEISGEEIERQMAALQAAEDSLKATLALADGAAESDVAQLTSVYENMKPEQAAAVFAQMEPGFAAGFLGRMRSDSAAAILAGLDPNLAYSISVILAGRNALAPTE